MMINFIISLINKVVCLWCDPISEAQNQYRKDHILDPYGTHGSWKDEQFWR